MNVWYLSQDGAYVIVRDGVVVQIGVADWSLAASRQAELALLDPLEEIYEQSVVVSARCRRLTVLGRDRRSQVRRRIRLWA